MTLLSALMVASLFIAALAVFGALLVSWAVSVVVLLLDFEDLSVKERVLLLVYGFALPGVALAILLYAHNPLGIA